MRFLRSHPFTFAVPFLFTMAILFHGVTVSKAADLIRCPIGQPWDPAIGDCGIPTPPPATPTERIDTAWDIKPYVGVGVEYWSKTLRYDDNLAGDYNFSTAALRGTIGAEFGPVGSQFRGYGEVSAFATLPSDINWTGTGAAQMPEADGQFFGGTVSVGAVFEVTDEITVSAGPRLSWVNGNFDVTGQGSQSESGIFGGGQIGLAFQPEGQRWSGAVNASWETRLDGFSSGRDGNANLYTVGAGFKFHF